MMRIVVSWCRSIGSRLLRTSTSAKKSIPRLLIKIGQTSLPHFTQYSNLATRKESRRDAAPRPVKPSALVYQHMKVTEVTAIAYLRTPSYPSPILRALAANRSASQQTVRNASKRAEMGYGWSGTVSYL